MKYLVTGGAGYIGSHICDRLLERGHEVVAIDNMSTGQERFLENASKNKNFVFANRDITQHANILDLWMQNVDCVYHFAANADIRKGFQDHSKDFSQNAVGTLNVLTAMKKSGVRKIVFASTAAIYGEPNIFPTPENCPLPNQTSLYGATKLAAEGLISAFCEGYGFEGYAFRFVTVLGPRYPHGFAFDFVRKLLDDPARLEVLGNGMAQKSSLHVNDCVDALMHICEDKQTAKTSDKKFQVYNIGTENWYYVKDAAQWVCDAMGLKPRLEFGSTIRGWPGDNPFIFLDCKKAIDTGWYPRYNAKTAVYETVEWLNNNKWIFEKR